MITHINECVYSHVLYSEILMELLNLCKKCKKIILIGRISVLCSHINIIENEVKQS